MKKTFKVLAYFFSAAILILIFGLTFIQFSFPRVDKPEDLKLDYTADRLARGKYLANHVNVCVDCHSTRDFSLFSGPPSSGTLGKGGDRFDHSMGFPGVFYAKNITPYGISDYTDGELYRLITTGVTNENSVMFPLMPYRYYGQMDPDDIYSIIAYIRTLPSVESNIPDSKADFPINFILRTIPINSSPTKRPNPSDQVAHGAYLVNAAGCVECHTPVNGQGEIIENLKFSGNRIFKNPDGSVLRSSNISSEQKTGIGAWTEEKFVNQFKQYADSAFVIPSIKNGEFNTIMPWTMYGGMTEEDLKAIYAYLQTTTPINKMVVKFSPFATGQ